MILFDIAQSHPFLAFAYLFVLIGALADFLERRHDPE